MTKMSCVFEHTVFTFLKNKASLCWYVHSWLVWLVTFLLAKYH